MNECCLDLVLNFFGKDVMLVYDCVFEWYEFDFNCWMLCVLLQVVEQKSGFEKLEQIWINMFNNDYVGGLCVGNISVDVISQMGWMKGGQYLIWLSVLEVIQVLDGCLVVDLNVIGGNSYYVIYFEVDRKWVSVSVGGGYVLMCEIIDFVCIVEFNDVCEVCLECQEKCIQFYLDDLYWVIICSLLIVVVDDVLDFVQVLICLVDIGFGYCEYVLLQQVCEGVVVIDVCVGCFYDENSECFVVSVMVLVCCNQFEWVDYVLLSVQIVEYLVGCNVFVVQGEMSDFVYLCVFMFIDVVVQMLVV